MKTKTKTYQLTCDALAALAILDKSMEITPEPFRMQKDVTFIFPFSEYLQFIPNYLREVDYLATPTNQLIQAYKTDDRKQLYKYYLKDMSVAVCKELHFAEERGKLCTTLQHKSSGTTVYDNNTLHGLYLEAYATTGVQLKDYMERSGFPLPKGFLPHNHIRWEYAVVLHFMSSITANEWEVLQIGEQ